MNTNKKKNKLSNKIHESDFKVFDILSRLCLDLSLKRIGHDFLNTYDAVMKKVVDHEELMDSMRSGPVIYLRSSKNFEIV